MLKQHRFSSPRLYSHMRALLPCVFILLFACQKNENEVPSIETKFHKSFSSEKKNTFVNENISGRTFSVSHGLVGKWYEFKDDSTYLYHFWCDICEGFFSAGNYRVNHDTVFFTDTIQHTTKPHFANPTDTVVTHDRISYQLYIWHFAEWIELRDTPQTADNINLYSTHAFFPDDCKKPELVPTLLMNSHDFQITNPRGNRSRP